MRAVRTRNELCVRFLLDKGAKVGVYDKVSINLPTLVNTTADSRYLELAYLE